MSSAKSEFGASSWVDISALAAEVLEHAPAAVLVVDASGRVVALNRRQEELTGDLLGKDMRQIAGLSALPWEQWLSHGTGGGSAGASVERMPASTGTGCAGILHVCRILDAGDLTGLLLVTHTGLRQGQARQTEQEWLQAWLESLPEAVMVVNRHQRVLAMSRVWQRMLQLGSYVPALSTCADVLCRKSWACSECAVAEVFQAQGGPGPVVRVHMAPHLGAHAIAAWSVPEDGLPASAAVVWLSQQVGDSLSGVAVREQSAGTHGRVEPLRLYDIALRACGCSVLVVDRQGHTVDRLGAPLCLPEGGPEKERSDLELVLGAEAAAVVRHFIRVGKAFYGRPRPSAPPTLVTAVPLPAGGEGAAVGVFPEPGEGQSEIAQDSLQRRLSIFAELGAVLAHELNNSLNAISHRVDCLRIEVTDGIDVVRAEAEVELLKEHVRRMGAATAELRQIASPTLEEPSLVDLNSVLERAIAASQVVAPRSAISLDKELCPELPGILGWAAELERCFRSIIDNAVEAMGGEGRLVVATRWLGDHNRVQVAIVDHGEGIRPEYLTRVWQPFFTTRKYRAALGLGLSLAYYTVLRHGGEMQVQSTPRRGTTVFMTLPANPSTARAEGRETGDRGREGAQTAMFAQRFEQSI